MSDFSEEPTDDFESRQRAQRAAELVGAAGLECGLYMERADVALTQGGESVLLVQFRVGDLAFTPRVLDPEVEDTNKAVRAMEVDARLDEFNRIVNETREGTGLLASLEAEPDDEDLGAAYGDRMFAPRDLTDDDAATVRDLLAGDDDDA